MMRRAVAAAVAAAFLAASPALAAPTTIVGKDAGNNPVTLGAVNNGAGGPISETHGLVDTNANPVNPATSDLQTSGNSKLDTLHGDNGAPGAGISAPFAGSGILGWLSGIFNNTSTAATAANQTTANGSLATIATNTTGAATAANQTAANTTLSQIQTNTAAGATAANQATANSSLATIATNTAASRAASGVTPVSCTLSAAGTCGPFTPIAGRGFHVSHAPSSVTGSCQVERKTDGTNWAIETVTASGSTTQMGNWSFSASSQAISEDFEESQASVAYQVHCISMSAGSDTITLSQ